MDELKPYRDYPVYDENPFRRDLVLHMTENKKDRVKRVIANDPVILDRETGQAIEKDGQTLFIGSVKEVDNEQFTKFYAAGIKLMTEVSKKSVNVFIMYIFPKLEKDSLQIIFDLDECAEITELSKPTIYLALSELINKGLIAKSKLNWLFYINPIYVFNGDRIRMVNDYIREGSERAKLHRRIDSQYSIGEGDGDSE